MATKCLQFPVDFFFTSENFTTLSLGSKYHEYIENRSRGGAAS